MPDFYIRVTVEADDSDHEDAVDDNEYDIASTLVSHIEDCYLDSVYVTTYCEGDCECESETDVGLTITNAEHVTNYAMRQRFGTATSLNSPSTIDRSSGIAHHAVAHNYK